MDKIYGYKMKDVTMLAEHLKLRGNNSLTSVFAEYGRKHGKAKGTVRNLYYALAKKSAEDQEFCQKYLGGKPLSVSKIVEFNECEERQLIKKILRGQSEGRSVRSTIMELANGDGKMALRYQNKYRNAIKNKPELIKLLAQELSQSGHDLSRLQINKSNDQHQENQKQLNQLKREIDGLIERISQKTKNENKALKERINSLEKENLRLLKIIYGQTDYFLASPKSVHDGGHNTIS